MTCHRSRRPPRSGNIAEQCDPPKSPFGRDFESSFFGGDWVIAAVRQPNTCSVDNCAVVMFVRKRCSKLDCFRAIIHCMNCSTHRNASPIHDLQARFKASSLLPDSIALLDLLEYHAENLRLIFLGQLLLGPISIRTMRSYGSTTIVTSKRCRTMRSTGVAELRCLAT